MPPSDAQVAKFQRAVIEDMVAQEILSLIVSDKKMYLGSCKQLALKDLLNDYVLGKLEVMRKQPPPKTLFQKPEPGPSSVEMVAWLHVFFLLQKNI